MEMELAWTSVSRSERATTCVLFQQDRIGTSEQWGQLSGYGTPKYAFVFPSQACT